MSEPVLEGSDSGDLRSSKEKVGSHITNQMHNSLTVSCYGRVRSA
jgi:hypothetical protein